MLRERGPNVIGAASVSLVVTCGCGSRVPLMLILVQGPPMISRCPDCKTQFRIRKIEYDVTTNKPMRVEIDHSVPQIIVPNNHAE